MREQLDSVDPNLHRKCALHTAPLPIEFGTHHSKFAILQYARSDGYGDGKKYPGGLRVIIHTANYIFRVREGRGEGGGERERERERERGR